MYLQLYGGGGYFQHDDDTQIKNNARNGYILFHIDIKKDSIGIYCLFLYACILISLRIRWYVLSVILQKWIGVRLHYDEMYCLR